MNDYAVSFILIRHRRYEGVKTQRLPILDIIEVAQASCRVSKLANLKCLGVRICRLIRHQGISARGGYRGNGRRRTVIKPSEPLLLEGVVMTLRSHGI